MTVKTREVSDHLTKTVNHPAMTIFIAQPDYYNRDINFEKLDKIKSCMSRRGYRCVAPQDNFFGKDATFADRMGQIITMLHNCDGVIFCDAWDTSLECTIIHDIVMRSKSFASIDPNAKDYKIIYES